MRYILFVISMCVLLTLSLVALAADPDLVIYYSFDNFGTVVLDQSGKGHDGTVVGDIAQDAAGKRGGAAKLTKGSYFDLKGETFPTTDIPSDAITLCLWAKPENTGDHQATLNARAEDQTWISHAEFRSDGKLRWLLRTAGGTTIFDIQNGQWTPDQWIHYAGVYDSAKNIGVLYINGEKIAEAAGNVKIAGDWKMGARLGKNIDDARPFVGLMDDFCLYKRALTQDDIKIIMVSGPPTASTVSAKGTLTTTWGSIKN
jgi:hypothetical protein